MDKDENRLFNQIAGYLIQIFIWRIDDFPFFNLLLQDMQSQLVCGGCWTVLLYPRRATNVSCALCNMVAPVPPTGMDMAQSICGGCLTLLMHAQGATSGETCLTTYKLLDFRRSSLHMHQTVGNSFPASKPSTSSATVPSQNQTVV